MLHHNGDRRLTEKRGTSEKHFVEDHSKRVDVGCWTDAMSLRLLWGHILRGSPKEIVEGSCSFLLFLTSSGNAEVDELDLPILSKHNIRGFHVLVNDTRAMGRT